jgi:hypothetical protein
MTTAARRAEVEEVDRFLAEQKSLTEGLPAWRESHITGRITAEWPVVDSDGVLREGTRLVFVAKASDISYLSVSLLLRGNRVFGVDLVPGSECKMNGPQAAKLGLPARVCGSHFHEWLDNRDMALSAGLGHMPHRRPTPTLLTRLPHALAAMAQAINLTLTPEQASFDVPPVRELPLKGGGR